MEVIERFLDMEVTVWQMMLIAGIAFVVWECASFWRIRRKEKRNEKREKEWAKIKEKYSDIW